MDSQNEIELRPEEFDDFFIQCMSLIEKGLEIYDHFTAINEETLTSMYEGKPFYLGGCAGMMVQFYEGYTANIGKLNSFYSKLWEYLAYVSQEMQYEDEKLKKLIDTYMTASKGGQ